LYHFDFYRLDNADEWDDAGVGEAFRDDSVCLVEWPERVAGLLPEPDLALRLERDATGASRRLHARATTDAGQRCLTALAALAD
jgi:tRNA threonylcarbamoyladenosine biosynthesis protein TsaE